MRTLFGWRTIIALACTVLVTGAACEATPTADGKPRPGHSATHSSGMPTTTEETPPPSAPPVGSFSEPTKLYRAVTSRARAQQTVRLKRAYTAGISKGSTATGRIRTREGTVVAGKVTLTRIFRGKGSEFGQVYILSGGNIFQERFESMRSSPIEKPWTKTRAGPVRPTTEHPKKWRRNALQQLSATAALAPLKAARDLEKCGKDTVDGVRTTCYKTTMRVSKAENTVAHGEWETVFEQQLYTGKKKAVFRLWIDAHGLPRKWTATFGNRHVAQRTPTIELTYSHWGEPLNLNVPAPNEIRRPVDLPELDSTK